jgi:ubiquitin carboxyl-terminal hydrolase 34
VRLIRQRRKEVSTLLYFTMRLSSTKLSRACLKDVPDNLIFHLKRFDYDLCTSTRSKINDLFEFPEEIDMAPYNVEYLKDPEKPIAADNFTLVGVLVHSGNAESGHYYSYIRERPSEFGDGGAWVEFNDADVTRFDPSNIPEQCFGGMSDPMPYSTMRFHKTWNAYMLFYQRTSSMKVERERHLPIIPGLPVKEAMPMEIGNHIAVENELYIRRYCFFDPEHAKFIKSLLEQHQTLSKGLCSENHDLEKEIIWLALEHSEQIFSRTKDCQTFHTVLDTVIKFANVCSECCKLSLDWVSHHELALRNLLLRSPDEEIRRKFGKMIAGALKYLRDNDHYLYGLDVHAFEQGSNQLPDPSRNFGALQAVLLRLKDLLPMMYLHPRAWDDYYGLLNDIAQFGRLECAMLHDNNFLAHCLEILIVDFSHGSLKRLIKEFPQHANYVRVLEKGRKFSFYNLLNLLAILFDAADLKSGVFANTYEDPLHTSNKYDVSPHEENLIRFGTETGRAKGMVFLDKAIGLDCNPLACQFIVRTLGGTDPALPLPGFVQQTILCGISIDPAAGARPYLQAALAFSEACRSMAHARNLLIGIAAEATSIGTSGGDDHLEFFGKARSIFNEHFSGREPDFFHNLVLHLVPRWAPTLLIYPDYTIRNETIELLHALVFSVDLHSMDDEQQAEEIEDVGKALCKACLTCINECVIIPNKQIEARQAEEVIRVVNHCVRTYYREEEEGERRQIAAQVDGM